MGRESLQRNATGDGFAYHMVIIRPTAANTRLLSEALTRYAFDHCVPHRPRSGD